MSVGGQFGRLAWWRREDDPAARARQAVAAMRAEKSGGSRSLWLDGSCVGNNDTHCDHGGSAGGGGTD